MINNLVILMSFGLELEITKVDESLPDDLDFKLRYQDHKEEWHVIDVPKEITPILIERLQITADKADCELYAVADEHEDLPDSLKSLAFCKDTMADLVYLVPMKVK